jgi:hypothetical protein
MHWVEFIVGLLLGGFLGITIMAVLVASGREDEDMERYFTSYGCKTGEIEASR